MRLIELLSYPQSGANALHNVIPLEYFTLFCNVVSILLKMMNLATVTVDHLRTNKMTAVKFKIFVGKDARVVVSKSQR